MERKWSGDESSAAVFGSHNGHISLCFKKWQRGSKIPTKGKNSTWHVQQTGCLNNMIIPLEESFILRSIHDYCKWQENFIFGFLWSPCLLVWRFVCMQGGRTKSWFFSANHASKHSNHQDQCFLDQHKQTLETWPETTRHSKIFRERYLISYC